MKWMLNFIPFYLNFIQSNTDIIDVPNDMAKTFPQIRIDSSYNQLMCYYEQTDSLVGIYIKDESLGFWNSETDTLKIDSNHIIVFKNPFPDVYINISDCDSINQNKPCPYTIDGFTYSFYQGKLTEACIRKNSIGTLKEYYYTDEDNNAFYMKQWINNNEIIWEEYYPSVKNY